MNMREKIADVFKRHHRDSCYPDAMDFEALAFADAVLDAMREPTEEMLIGARDWSLKKYGQGVGDDGATGCWHVMIDAAKGRPPK